MSVRHGRVVTPRDAAFIARAKLAYGKVLAGLDGGALPYDGFKEYLEWRKIWYDNAIDCFALRAVRTVPHSEFLSRHTTNPTRWWGDYGHSHGALRTDPEAG